MVYLGQGASSVLLEAAPLRLERKDCSVHFCDLEPAQLKGRGNEGVPGIQDDFCLNFYLHTVTSY